METALFWVAWGLITFWALKTFYFSFSKEKFEQLRKAALGINLAVLILTFLPWLPSSLGGKSGITLALEGNILAVIFILLTIASAVIFFTKSSSLYKLASSATIANAFILFALMYLLRPETFILSLLDLTPIIAFMMLLVGDVVVLFLWQQLQLKQHKKAEKINLDGN